MSTYYALYEGREGIAYKMPSPPPPDAPRVRFESSEDDLVIYTTAYDPRLMLLGEKDMADGAYQDDGLEAARERAAAVVSSRKAKQAQSAALDAVLVHYRIAIHGNIDMQTCDDVGKFGTYDPATVTCPLCQRILLLGEPAPQESLPVEDWDDA